MERDKARVVRCSDREDGDVSQMREASVSGHPSRLVKATVDHIAMAGPLKDPSGNRIVGSLPAYRTDGLEQAKAWLGGDPCARCGIWVELEWSRLVLVAGSLVGGVTW
jgi:uncharacterized protein YciI